MQNLLQTLNYQPSHLTESELSNPAETIKSFFENNELHEVRAVIWEMYKGWVNGSVAYIEPKENAEMLFFYSQLIDFIDASFLLVEFDSSSI